MTSAPDQSKMGDIDSKKKYVNGPVNVVRLEGKINDIRKVIYLFMDFHMPLGMQTECNNIYAKQPQTFILDNFLKLPKSGKMVDVFLEETASTILDPYHTTYGHSVYDLKGKELTRIYIRKIISTFKKLFNYDPDMNKVFKTPVIENLRVHYADIRSMFPQEVWGDDIAHIVYGVENPNGNIDWVIQYLNRLISFWEKFKNILESCFNDKSSCQVTEYPHTTSLPQPYTEEWEKYIKHILYKMIHVYKYPTVQKKLNRIFGEEITNINKLLKLLNDFISAYLEIHNKVVSSFEVKNDPSFFIRNNYYYDTYGRNEIIMNQDRNVLLDISKKIQYYYRVNIIYMDIFFLRRFLDKDYITNVTAYTGALHSAHYAMVLVQEFGFNITHTALLEQPNVNDLTKKIKSAKHLSEVEYLLYPTILYQCSDLTNFPDLFD